MGDKTEVDPGSDDRRQGDRRTAADGDYTGPERRVRDRRSGQDRRKSPRF